MSSIEKQLYILNKLSFRQKESLLFIHNKNFQSSQWKMEYLEKFFNAKNIPIYLQLEIDKQLAGFAIGKIDKNNDKYILHAISIDEKFRGKGYGEIVIKKFIEEAFKNEKIQKVVIHFRDSKNLRGFYEKVGFNGHMLEGIYRDGEKKHYMEFNRG